MVELGEDVEDVVDVDVGDGHVVVLTARGEVWVSGEDSWGQLGLGPVPSGRPKEGEDGFVAEWVRCI